VVPVAAFIDWPTDVMGEPYEVSEIKSELSSTLWQLTFGPGERSHHQQ